MALRSETAAHFEAQAAACERLGSGFTAKVCRLLIEILDETTRTGALIDHWEGDLRQDAVALRICGGFHRLVLESKNDDLAACYPPNPTSDFTLKSALQRALSEHDYLLAESIASPPQTNEIGRSAMLLPGFLAIAKRFKLPMSLHEIGSSAGLNLLFDKFFYQYGATGWGIQDSPVVLEPDLHGKTPYLSGKIEIISREGCDIAPIDVNQSADRLRLRSYVWPDQFARLSRLDGAIKLAETTDFTLTRMDAASFVEQRLAKSTPNTVFVLFHSIMWQYMPLDTRQSIIQTLKNAGQKATIEAPIAHLRMEPLTADAPHATLSLTLWPDGKTHHLAHCDYHGRWIKMLA